MNTTQNVKQFKDHEPLAQKGKFSAVTNQATGNQSAQQDWDIVTALNQCLAHSIELSCRIKQAHWGAKGESFYVFHKMSGDFTQELAKQADKLSARIVAVEGMPKWTPEKVAQLSLLPSYPGEMIKIADHIEALTNNYEQVIQQLQPLMNLATKSDDYVTVNVITGFNKVLDEQKGFLMAHSGLSWLDRSKKQYAS